ncbi:MAG: hypothetical protein KY391_01110 [Actinobacteria bacterium]|nr:hypothetical protein [Actinomycetota bacterium]
MSDHVVIRKLEHLRGNARAPALRYAIETRATAGPAFKNGAFAGDVVWIKLHGGLMIGKAQIKIAWVGEYSSLREIQARTAGSAIQNDASFWAGRPKFGYAVVAELQNERWLEPKWQGPRTYGYEWVVMDSDNKATTWFAEKPPPRGGEDLLKRFLEWRDGS